jgi:hypothetical protein
MLPAVSKDEKAPSAQTGDAMSFGKEYLYYCIFNPKFGHTICVLTLSSSHVHSLTPRPALLCEIGPYHFVLFLNMASCELLANGVLLDVKNPQGLHILLNDSI